MGRPKLTVSEALAEAEAIGTPEAALDVLEQIPDTRDIARQMKAAQEFKELAQSVGYAPVVPTVPVLVHLTKPLAGTVGRIKGAYDQARGVICVQLGKQSLEFSIHSQLVMKWELLK